MATQQLQIHRLGLNRLVVEGNLQPIVRFASLTLKDEEHNKQIMQVHVDGQRLAQWDLGMLREAQLLGAEKFFTIDEQRMLQFTLPLSEEDGQEVASMKTIQLFIINVMDFQTAVDYLSNNAGMQHCHINRALQNLRDVSVPELAPISKTQESLGTSNMGPPTMPLMGRSMRPQSQTSVYAPVRYSPMQPGHRSQTARPNLTYVPGSSSHYPPAPGTTGPIRGRTSSQGNRYWSSPFISPLEPRSSVVPGTSSLPRRFLSKGLGVHDLGERNPLYEQHIAPMGSHPPPYPLRHDPWGIPLSSSQVETDTGNLPDEPYHDRFAAQLASQSDRTLPPARRTVSSRTYPFGWRPSSRPPTERPSSPSSPFSDSGVPIRIQVLSLPDQPRYSSLHSKIRWEFTLHLLPSTKMYELCLHAASYILREYRVPVDGRDLAAQSMDGSLCEDQDSLSDESLQGQAVLLVERGLLSTGKSVPVKSRESYPESLHVDWRPEAGKLDGSHTASIREPRPHATDEPDQVPPPRQLPFPSVATSSTSKPAARSPLSERPDLMNANAPARADKRSTQPASQTEAAAEKQPNQSQKRPTTISRRPVSSTSGSKLNSVTGAAESSKPQASARRPETSLGIRRKSKTRSGDEGVSMPPVIGSLTSDNGVRTEELATSSCISCRNKKRKCDRSKPACGPCLKDKRHCKYPNIPKAAATGHMPEKACDKPVLDTAAHLMIRRSQALVPPTMVSDALTQTPHPREYRDVGSQTRGIEEENRDVAMKDLGKDSHKLYTDTSTQTDRSDDFWVPFSQCTEVVLWASNQYERQIQKAVEILRTTDPSRDDYREKLAQAAEYYLEYEEDLEEKLEEVLRR